MRLANPIPLVDVRLQCREIQSEVDLAIKAVVNAAAFVNGPDVAAFEREFSDYLSVGYCAGVSSGTAALKLALQAIGIGPGDEVILPVNTFISGAFAVSHVGANPVFVDIDEHYTIDTDAIVAAISARTKAIMAVHLYGNAADIRRIVEIARERNLKVIEDVSQAHGAALGGRRLGGFGDVAAFSFYPGKNLGAFGDGGAVCGNDAEIDRRVRLLRDLGQKRKHEHSLIGDNCRLDTLQAAVLRVKLRRLDEWNQRRRLAAAEYDRLLAGAGFAVPPRRDGCDHAYQYYVVNVRDRAAVIERLAADGIQAGVHHPMPIHLQPAYRHLGLGRGTFPRSETSCETILSLPMFPGITSSQIERVASTLVSCAAPVAYAWA